MSRKNRQRVSQSPSSPVENPTTEERTPEPTTHPVMFETVPVGRVFDWCGITFEKLSHVYGECLDDPGRSQYFANRAKVTLVPEDEVDSEDDEPEPEKPEVAPEPKVVEPKKSEPVPPVVEPPADAGSVKVNEVDPPETK